MSTTEYVRAGLTATVLWAALLAAVVLGGNNPTSVDSSTGATRTAQAGAAVATAADVR
jgi:hypothetical protein